MNDGVGSSEYPPTGVRIRDIQCGILLPSSHTDPAADSCTHG